MVKVKGDHSEATEIPNDHLEERIAETFDFDVILTLMESSGSQLLNALSNLETTPSLLLDGIAKSYTAGSDCAEQLACLSKQFTACSSYLLNGMAHLKELMQLIQEVRPRIAVAKDAIAARQAAWVAKIRSDRTDTAQLKAKHEADELFKTTTRETKQTLDNLLSLRWPITGTALAEFCHCYAGIFETPPKLANELYNSAAKLTGCRAQIQMGFVSEDVINVTQESINMPPLPAPMLPPELSMTLPKYSKGDKVEVWSDSKKKWFPATVQKIFSGQELWDKYMVPAGAIQVESPAGLKFVRPDQTNVLLRKYTGSFFERRS